MAQHIMRHGLHVLGDDEGPSLQKGPGLGHVGHGERRAGGGAVRDVRGRAAGGGDEVDDVAAEALFDVYGGGEAGHFVDLGELEDGADLDAGGGGVEVHGEHAQ